MTSRAWCSTSPERSQCEGRCIRGRKGEPVPPAYVPELHLSVDKFGAGARGYLEGAQLAIVDANGQTIESWTSGSGVHEVSAPLTAGESYTLVETSAPQGYDPVADTEFTVSADGTGIAITSKEATTSPEEPRL